jgi:hypothetical protein
MTQIAVILAGAAGLALVARAALVYRGADPLAYGLVLLIALGLSLGTLELAEMAAVAEMFAGAVDRYREAGDRWLDSLGAIEEALERKGRGDTADLLGAFLDQTREVFECSLRFQREPYSELRALRSRTG